jgi:hypothetical protein
MTTEIKMLIVNIDDNAKEKKKNRRKIYIIKFDIRIIVFY